MILFLDDSPERAAVAYNRMNEEESSHTIWCKTAEEAIITLRDYSDVLTKVYLDHDLGNEGEEMSVKSDGSGMEVLRWMAQNLDKVDQLRDNDCEFIVHTWNAYAGKIMKERLDNFNLKVKFIPFGMGEK